MLLTFAGRLDGRFSTLILSCGENFASAVFFLEVCNWGFLDQSRSRPPSGDGR